MTHRLDYAMSPWMKVFCTVSQFSSIPQTQYSRTLFYRRWFPHTHAYKFSICGSLCHNVVFQRTGCELWVVSPLVWGALHNDQHWDPQSLNVSSVKVAQRNSARCESGKCWPNIKHRHTHIDVDMPFPQEHTQASLFRALKSHILCLCPW